MSSMLDLPHPAEAPPLDAVPILRAVPDPVVEPLDFDDVVRRLSPRLQRYATRRLGDRHEAEELVQEALLRAFDHRAELATEDDVAAWTTCVTGRLVIDRLRVRGRSTSVAEVPEGTRVGRDTADVVVARDEARLALDALDAMPPRQAAVLWAREVEGLAYDEIGERFGMTEPAVRSVLMRARKALRKEFATRGGTLPAGGLVALAPWLDSLTWLDRLRRLAGRAAAPAAIGAASLGLIGGIAVAPWEGAAPGPRPAIRSVPFEVAAARASIPTDTAQLVAPTVVAPRARVVPAAGPDRVTSTVVGAAPTDQTCASASGEQGLLVGAGNGSERSAGAGGSGCAPETTSTVYVGPTLPDNATGVRRLGVDTNQDCSALPSSPLTQCTSEGDPR